MDGLHTDGSFTPFLSDPDSYRNGEFVIESPAGEDAVKLAAGSLVAYPSTTLRRVARGHPGRTACRRRLGAKPDPRRPPDTRSCSIAIPRARCSHARGKSAEFDLLAKSTANLLRMWVED